MKRITLVCAIALLAMGTFVFYQVSAQHHKTVPVSLVTQDENAVDNATVSFGAWMTNPPLDRFPNNANNQFPRTRNHHVLVPRIATIRTGGTVNFIIGGFHVVAIYDGNRLPSEIDTTNLILPANPPGQNPPGPPIINDPVGRIYRGLDPTVLPLNAQQDRVEVVHFDRPGLYLVICAVLPHFQEGMYGYVRVVGRGDFPGDNGNNGQKQSE